MKKLIFFILFSIIISALHAQINSVSILGPATPGHWNTDTDMTQSQENTAVWTISMTLTSGKVKFRANGNWDINWGGADFPNGVAVLYGDNIEVEEGQYNINFNTETLEYSFSPVENPVSQNSNKNCTGVVGDIKYSVLPPEKFQQLNGECWILADGRQVTSSKVAQLSGLQKIPDYQGVFIRGMELRTTGRKDPDRSVTAPVGQYQSDVYKSHSHSFQYLMATEWVNVSKPINTGVEEYPSTLVFSNREWYSGNTISVGGEETRPKNATAYTYIRIN